MQHTQAKVGGQQQIPDHPGPDQPCAQESHRRLSTNLVPAPQDICVRCCKQATFHATAPGNTDHGELFRSSQLVLIQKASLLKLAPEYVMKGYRAVATLMQRINVRL